MIDRIECRALKLALGESAGLIPVTSIKGAVGGGLCSPGALQVASAALSLGSGSVPPTLNCEHRDPECDLNYARQAVHCDMDAALVNSHGTGGVNTALVLGRCEP